MESQGSATARAFVLVTGVHHGGWCYSRVAEVLRSHGHRVYTPTLSGHAERARENYRAINLSTHIQDILDVFEFEELDDVVLCGHSYGGMVVGGVADKIPHKINHLVYLDAVVPENGKSMCDYVFPGEALHEFIDHIGEFGDGIACPAPLADKFNVKEAEKERVDRLSTPQPIGTLLQKIQIGSNAGSIKNHTYIYATNWGHPAIDLQYERAKARAGWKVFEVESGHDIMIDAPDELAEILNGLD
jgi:hypothetical protein